MQIQGSKALVTGGGSGMGRAFVLELARAGADVAFCDLNVDAIRAVEQEAQGLPGQVIGYEANVSDEASVETLMASAWEALGGLNILINNAGIIRDGLLVKKDKETNQVKTLSLKNWQQVIDVNLTGPFLCTRAFSARQVETGFGPGVIVSISSISRHGNMGQSNYSAAKAGLIADTALWARELARYNIRVGAIAPGFVNTPILQGMRPDALEQMLKPVPLRRLGEPTEIWMAVRFIIECDYFTGRCVDVDGGLTL